MEKPGIEPATPGSQGIALIHYTTDHIDFMMQPFLLGFVLNMPFDLILTQKLILLGILSNCNLSIKELN